MFKQIGQIASMLKNLPKLREEMDRLQGRIGQITAEGDAGGGMVKVRVNGHMEVVRCDISDEALKMNDKELLEDLIKGAVNQGLQRVRKAVAEETSSLDGSINLPEDFKLPEPQG